MAQQYVRIVNGQPEKTSFALLRKAYPNTSFPKTPPPSLLAEYGLFELVEENEPPTADNQVVTKYEAPTPQPDGSYVWRWAVRDKTQAELNAEDLSRIDKIKANLDWNGSAVKVLLKISFLQENRIRVLEGQPEITATQFRTWVNGQID